MAAYVCLEAFIDLKRFLPNYPLLLSFKSLAALYSMKRYTLQLCLGQFFQKNVCAL